jgi:putative restriction endonuclease
MIWDEFNSDWEKLAVESELAMARLGLKLEAGDIQQQDNLGTVPSHRANEPSGPSEVVGQAKIRLHQKFFRQTILSAYRFKCCICDISVPQFLTACHIIPWARRDDLRANPHNGLCLCSLHHDAFDNGFLTVDREYRVHISKRMNQFLPNAVLEVTFHRYASHAIALPEKFGPDKAFLLFHNEQLFHD